MMKRAMLLFLIIAVTGCGRSEESPSGNAKSAPPAHDAYGPAIAQNAPPPPPQAPSPAGSPGNGGAPPATPPLSAAQSADRQLIRNGEITIRVASLDSAERAVGAIATANGGYTSNSSRERASGNALSGSTQIRVPAAKFDLALAGVRKLGEVERESVSSSDVTEEYVDLNARLKTQQELEARLLDLLNGRSGKLSDIIEIEGKLADVRREIESIQGRLRLLEGQVSYSTLTVAMFEPGAVGTSDTETFAGRMKRALDAGVDGLIDVLGGLITVVLALIPVAAIIILLWLLLRPALRRRRARKAAATAAGAGTDTQR
jgi:hypothetical protein